MHVFLAASINPGTNRFGRHAYSRRVCIQYTLYSEISKSPCFDASGVDRRNNRSLLSLSHTHTRTNTFPLGVMNYSGADTPIPGTLVDAGPDKGPASISALSHARSRGSHFGVGRRGSWKLSSTTLCCCHTSLIHTMDIYIHRGWSCVTRLS